MGTEKSKQAEKKVMDVSKPSQVAASPTSRPVIVTNRPLITQDPMVTGGENTEPAKTTDAKQSAAVTPHAEKVIKPLKDQAADSAPETEEDKPKDEAEPFSIGSKESSTEPITEKTKAEAETESTEAAADDAAEEAPGETKKSVDATAEPSQPDDGEKPSEATAGSDTAAEITSDEIESQTVADDDSESTAEATPLSPEEQKRTAEIEAAIASGKYFVPINARGKRRTLIATVWLVVLTVVLAVILVDALLDVGMLTLPGVPHTHFFSLT
ncbi:hypothetical protein EYC59_04485 [Candidatus Saccharibacteria bacterium]|nr:MAG: hypothetical protein EYC59_04485 [Candidatus Saccharibacteria bacterium]